MTALLKQWPAKLLDHIRLYGMDSMAFYKEMERRRIAPDLVFVDGNHEYEFALFDIGSAARYLNRGGFIVVDNIAQPGPFFAARDFVTANPGWHEIGTTLKDFDRTKSFDPGRTTITDTDFLVLRASPAYSVDARPWNVSRIRQLSHRVRGVTLNVAAAGGPGTLHLEIVLRGFGATPVEALGGASLTFTPTLGPLIVELPTPLTVSGQFTHYTVEPWLIWQGEGPLQLSRLPEPF